MSPPRAYVVHRARGRVRLRIPERRNDAQYFADLEEAFRSARGLREVCVNPGTSSVLLLAQGSDLDGSILERLARQGRYELCEGEPPAATPLVTMARAMSELGVSLQQRTEGRWDLASLGFYVLVGGGLYQLVKGRFMPAGGALFLTALSLVTREAERQRQRS